VVLSTRSLVLRVVLVFLEYCTIGDAVVHNESILAAVFVILSQHLDGLEHHVTEKKLSREIGLADGQGDLGPVVAGQIADEFADHLFADAKPAIAWMHGEVEYAQLDLVQFVYREADHLVVELDDYVDEVSLVHAVTKIFLGPGVVKGHPLDLQDFRHVTPKHVTNVDAESSFYQLPSRVHGNLSLFVVHLSPRDRQN